MHTFHDEKGCTSYYFSFHLCGSAGTKNKNKTKAGKTGKAGKECLIGMSENVQHTCKDQLKSQIATTHLLESQHSQFQRFHSYFLPTVQMPAATSR